MIVSALLFFASPNRNASVLTLLPPRARLITSSRLTRVLRPSLVLIDRACSRGVGKIGKTDPGSCRDLGIDSEVVTNIHHHVGSAHGFSNSIATLGRHGVSR